MKLQHKITLILAIVITLLITLLTAGMFITWYRSIQKQVAMDAMDQAIIIAEMPEVKSNIIQSNGYIAVNKAVEKIHLKTGIQYLYVLTKQGLYYAHPIPEKLNTPVSNTDLKLDHQHSEPVYYYEMTKDAMVEGYAPIYSDGLLSGVVVVGIYNGRILQSMNSFAIQLTLFAVLAISVGTLIAYGLSKNIKKSIHGLEPLEIGELLTDRENILENIGDGLIAFNKFGKITMINSKALELIDQPESTPCASITELPFFHFIAASIQDLSRHHETEWRIGLNKILKIELIPRMGLQAHQGWLCRIEDMSLIRRRAEELTNMHQLTQALRAQNHEFMNKLHTISGLIQLESYDDALNFIERVYQTRQAIIGQLNDKIKVPFLSGLLLAKYSKALERNIHFSISPNTSLSTLPDHFIDEDISSILGNLIDNAIDVLTGHNEGTIHIEITEDAQAIRFLVSDNGPGIKTLPVEKCLEKGISTKGKDRGFGLYIVQEKINKANGHLTLVNSSGLTCTVVLPKRLEKL